MAGRTSDARSIPHTEALPRRVQPMLAAAALEPFDSRDHLFEVKWDGIRTLTYVDARGYRLFTRRHRDVTGQYPELAVLAGIPPGTVLDGELVVVRDGRPHFGSVLTRHATADPLKVRCLARSATVTYVVFDCLYTDYRSVMCEPLRDRRELLRATLEELSQPGVVLSEGVIGAGVAFFEAICSKRLEGMMAKALASPYRPGRRTRAWLKMKPHTGRPR